mmetsp:Transcript_133910/g.199134  ORF Transcript_133910/g.199134 Transcript_133910/m.199134 type:complete len:372 (+) Transcript_133910:63-1178(+)|eukprot:CAMPEP_0117014322 /NCGR_PEP_ID=MMETSP0472-20121206/11642_1 /TAXON_ID=693140 ORGANISM="Tiarina fusus, Strain LIS" /NCGR_SAMPLE_ID=MMETSP0472 /ASSEMBLY_ACC=CAM_ASM_000603 /LENGTH=371 /DNA_ID=CAMNT_0004717855 /DNA_START=55 /DNA_END=1170 /DNA_ORIENTATION=-
MGNHSSKPTALQKFKKITSPLSPRRGKKSQKFTTPMSPKQKPVSKFDWLSRYNPTPNNADPLGLENNYQFEDFMLHHDQALGEGAFAKVILATHIPSRQKVAVKITTKKSIPQEMREYVVKEPGVLAQLNHENIVSLLLVHENANYIYMFLQYMPGGDLHSRLERDGSVSEEHAKEWFSQIVAALDFTHKKNFCHRDLKLENLLISGEGKKAKILMIDYGFAGFMPTEDHLFDDFPGSFCYAAPELIRGVPYIGRSADIYSLGVILYTMLQSTYPFYSEDKREMTGMILDDEVCFDTYCTSSARELVKWMLMKNPDHRPTLEQIKNHSWLRNEPRLKPLSPLKHTVSRIKETARASLSPVQSRRRARASVA